jgi:hypothetical protein
MQGQVPGVSGLPSDREIEPGGKLSPARASRRWRWRLGIVGIIAGSYALDTIILLLYAAAGSTTFRVPLLYALVGAAMCSVQLGVYRVGIVRATRDPFLTVWFVVPSVIVQVAFLAMAPEVGFVFLTAIFIVFGFCALRLTIEETALTWAVTTLSVAGLICSYSVPVVIPLRTPAERWISCLDFVLTLGRCAIVGAFGSSFRAHLSERTAALRRLTASLEEQIQERTRELAHANDELEQLLAERTDEIRTLRGVLPICAHCKKIRDDQGAWNQLEAYITAHADVHFSHGICADCAKKHFPQLRGSAGS